MLSYAPSPRDRAQAILELRRRERLKHPARASMQAFTRHTKPDYEVNWHHELLCGYLDQFVAGDIKRLMVFMPPRHGKSELVSRRLPAYILGRNPDARIIACSYGADLARRMNRDVQRIIDDESYQFLFPDTSLFGKNIRTIAHGSYLRNSDLFEVVGFRGYYRGTGIGGAITGMGMNYGIIDDPYKNRQDANSTTIRENVWDWYNSVFRTRAHAGAGILLTTTRWHHLDIAGQLLNLAESDKDADQWVVLSLPAIAEDPVAVYDPRQPGEPLWSTWFGEEMLKATKASSPYDWASMYQQRPAPREGGLFKREYFSQILPAVNLEGAALVRYWDKAGTRDAGAYTAGLLLAQLNDGRYAILDLIMGQWEAPEREAVIKQTAIVDTQKYGLVHVGVEQEPGSGGKESAQATARNLDGFRVLLDAPKGDKELRAEPVATQAMVGGLILISAPWNSQFIDMACMFPNGIKDAIDALSGAYKLLQPADTQTVVYHNPVQISEF